MVFAYVDPAEGSAWVQAGMGVIFALTILALVLWAILRAIGQVRDAVDRQRQATEAQTRLIAHIAQAAGTLPPSR